MIRPVEIRSSAFQNLTIAACARAVNLLIEEHNAEIEGRGKTPGEMLEWSDPNVDTPVSTKVD